MAGRVENHQSQNVNVPHTVDASEECRSVFQFDVFVPLILSFRNLPQDESDDSEESTDESGDHQKLETPNDAFVVDSSCLRHRWKYLTFDADVFEHVVDHVAKEKEISSRRKSAQSDECHL